MKETHRFNDRNGHNVTVTMDEGFANVTCAKCPDGNALGSCRIAALLRALATYPSSRDMLVETVFDHVGAQGVIRVLTNVMMKSQQKVNEAKLN